MIDWASVKPALKQWVASCTGAQVLFKNEAEGATYRKPTWVVLDVLRVRSYDQDDTGTREVVTSEGVTVLREYVAGQRTITLRVVSFTLPQVGGSWAGDVLEALRTRAQFARNAAILEAAKVALAAMGEHIQEDVEIDDRMCSAWYVDVDLNVSFEFVDTGTGAEDIAFIQYVEGSGEVPEGSTPIPWSTPGDWEVTTPSNTPTVLIPPLSIPPGGRRFQVFVTATDEEKGSIVVWELLVQVSITELSVTTLKKITTPGTRVSTVDIAPSLSSGSFKLEVVGLLAVSILWMGKVIPIT